MFEFDYKRSVLICRKGYQNNKLNGVTKNRKIFSKHDSAVEIVDSLSTNESFRSVKLLSISLFGETI